eukprot:783584_1
MGAEQRIFDRRDENESVETASETTTLSSEVEHAKDAMLHAVESAEKAAIHAIEDEVDLMFHSLPKHSKEPAQSVKQQEQSGGKAFVRKIDDAPKEFLSLDTLEHMLESPFN